MNEKEKKKKMHTNTIWVAVSYVQVRGQFNGMDAVKNNFAAFK